MQRRHGKFCNYKELKKYRKNKCTYTLSKCWNIVTKFSNGSVKIISENKEINKRLFCYFVNGILLKVFRSNKKSSLYAICVRYLFHNNWVKSFQSKFHAKVKTFSRNAKLVNCLLVKEVKWGSRHDLTKKVNKIIIWKILCSNIFFKYISILLLYFSFKAKSHLTT